MADELITFDGWAVLTTFEVDRPKRQIQGMILPYGVAAWDSARTAKWEFGRGSVGVPTNASRVKLLLEHDLHRVVGKALAFEDRPDGLWGSFYVKRGPEGDQVLADAEDRVLDGFSVGPAFDSPADWEVGSDGTRRVRASRLVETTITAMPAFDDARVASVAAERAGGSMGSKDEGQGAGSGEGQGTATVLENGGEAMARFEAELDARFDKVTERLTGAFESVTKGLVESYDKIVTDAMAASYSRLEGVQAAVDAEFSAARIKVISEPPVYRFDSDPRGYSMVRDFWRANTERDHDCVDRLRKFQAQQRDMVALLQRMPPGAAAQFANVTQAVGAAVIPPGYRPDLFVTELRRNRPLMSLGSRGTITDATPFTVPRFVSSTTATADHVEGTNPTDGSLVVDSVTVSPGAVSGLFKLTREIVDAANPAIDAIALGTMRESYNRQTEQKCYTELNINANVGTFTNVSLALLDTDPELLVDQTIMPTRDLLAKYPFTRFSSPDGAAIGQLVTRNFANAKDSTGRPLLSSVGDAAAAGIGNALTQGWFVDGLAFTPAWAMTQAVGDELALIVNSQDYWVWESPLLTFRFEERSGPALIELALFAYFANKVLRPAGIASLRAVA
jgi:HK97 family phage prohead protease/HK97 family phage major capsid protein